MAIRVHPVSLLRRSPADYPLSARCRWRGAGEPPAPLQFSAARLLRLCRPPLRWGYCPKEVRVGLLDGSVKKLEQSGNCKGLVKLLVDSEGRLGGMKCFDIVDALERLGPAAVPALVSALDEGHPGVPAALARIGPVSLPGVSRKLRAGGPDAQIGATLAILMMKLHGDPIDTDTFGELERLRDTSPHMQVVAFAIAGLRPRDKAKRFGYYRIGSSQEEAGGLPTRQTGIWAMGRRRCTLGVPVGSEPSP